MTLRWVTLGAVLTVAVASCSGGDDTDAAPTTTAEPTSTTTTAPERPASTTTTAFDPATVEGEVEAAYLKSWDVYADAVYTLHLDEQALAEVYADTSLEGKKGEIRDRIASGRAALVRVEHEYDVIVLDESSAHVVDRFVNHQVLIDPVTKEPVEDDPDERLVFNFELENTENGWRVTFIEQVNL